MKSTLATLLAMRGEFERARELARDAQALLDDLGPTVSSASSSLEIAWLERLAGELEAAERELRRDYDALTELGERYFLSTVAGELARVLYEQGRVNEAEQMSRQAQHLADDDDIASQMLWRTVLAKVRAHRGDCDGALALVKEAVDLLTSTDAVSAQAETLVDLAEILRCAGRVKDADRVLEDAIGLYELKGNLAGAELARASAAPAHFIQPL